MIDINSDAAEEEEAERRSVSESIDDTKDNELRERTRCLTSFSSVVSWDGWYFSLSCRDFLSIFSLSVFSLRSAPLGFAKQEVDSWNRIPFGSQRTHEGDRFVPWRPWPGSCRNGRAPCIRRVHWWWTYPPGCGRALPFPRRASWGWTRCWCSWPGETKKGFDSREFLLTVFTVPTEASCTWMNTEAFLTGSQRNSMVLRCRGCEHGSSIPTDNGISANSQSVYIGYKVIYKTFPVGPCQLSCLRCLNATVFLPNLLYFQVFQALFQSVQSLTTLKTCLSSVCWRNCKDRF